MARPRMFDEERLLNYAQETFWAHGYDLTSIDDISRGTGVGNGSIYAAYGSKLALFLAVFGRYCDSRVEVVRAAARAQTASFERAVQRYLEEVVVDCTSHPDRRGCLMLNSVAALAGRFPDVVTVARRATDDMERSWVERIGKTPPAELRIAEPEIRPLAAHIVLVSQGLIQLSRSGATEEGLRHIADASSAMVAARYAA